MNLYPLTDKEINIIARMTYGELTKEKKETN